MSGIATTLAEEFVGTRLALPIARFAMPKPTPHIASPNLTPSHVPDVFQTQTPTTAPWTTIAVSETSACPHPQLVNLQKEKLKNNFVCLYVVRLFGLSHGIYSWGE